MTTMRVVILANRLPSPPLGGIARTLQGLLYAFKRTGAHTTLVVPQSTKTPAATRDKESPPPIEMSSAAAHAQISRAHLLIVTGSSSMFRNWRQDVAQAVSRCPGKTVMLLLFPMEEVVLYYGTADGRNVARAIADLAGGFDAVVVPSTFSQREMSCWTGVAPMTVVRLGSGRYIAPGSRPAGGRPTVACLSRMGNHTLHKNIPHLLMAWSDVLKTLPDAELLMIGPRSRELAEIPGVRALGELDDASLGETLARCDLFVHPSTIESFALSVAEALRAGLPVITMDATALPELVRNDVNGLTLPTASAPHSIRGESLRRRIPDPYRLGAALTALLQDDALRSRYAAHAAPSVTHLTWTATADSLATGVH
jgi:glycosyltransferase involved in cell wall biosynthesis